VAGSGAARGAGGRRGSAPSPRANAPRHSLACARAGTVFRARARGAVSPPPGPVTGKKAREWRGAALPGVQDTHVLKRALVR